MAAHSFDSLLRELGPLLGIPDLQSTQNNNVSIQLGNHKHLITLEKHRKSPILIISIAIAELQTGRFTENIFREALRFNGQNGLHTGSFGFSKSAQKLFLFEMLPLEFISPEQVSSILVSLSKTAAEWIDGINRGDIPTIQTTSSTTTSKNSAPFGIKL
jgi:hypothetical protein